MIYKPLVKSFSDNALFALEQQKKDEPFSKYVRSVILERYLDQTVTPATLAKKLSTRNPFQKDLLWDAISLKLMSAPIVEMNQAMKLVDQMPIDYLVRIGQNARQEPLKQYAKIVCYEKQLELEEQLGLDPIDYEKFEEDERVINGTTDKPMLKIKCIGRKENEKS